MNNYSELKGVVRKELNSLRGLVCGDGALREVDGLLEKLDADSFNLVVLGQFKRGKTTFINALLGANVLPTAVVPLTSIITAIRYGSAPKTTVIYLDGRSEEIEPSRLGDYVTERGNPKNSRRVGHVEMEYPSGYLKGGVMIIDTPGIGSTFLHNTEVTYNFLSKVDAAVFMLSVDPPVSEVELKFLGDVSKHVKKLFFVLNKVDNASAADVSESIAFNTAVIGEKLGEEPKLYPLSARQALEAKLKGDPELLRKSGYTDFEFELEHFLTEEKGKVLLRSIVDRASGLVEARRLSLSIEKRTMELSARALEEKAALFNGELERFLRDRDANVHLIEWDVDSIIKTMDEDIGRFKKDMAPVVARQVEEFIDSYPRSGNREFLNAVKERLYQAVSDACDAWRVREEEKVTRLYAEKAKAHAERLDEFIRRIEKASSDIFNVEVKHYSLGCPVDLHTPLFYGIDAFMEEGMLIDATATTLNLLLPSPLFRAQVKGAIREKAERSLDMNSGRIRYAFLESLLKSSKAMKASYESVADTLIASVRSAIERARAEKAMPEDTGKRSAEIDRLLAALDGHRMRLEAIEASYLQP
jgi:GTPase SAR1 family protein